MEIQQNILYVLTQESYVNRDHLALQVIADDRVRLAVPIHNLQGLALFGNIRVSPWALELCADNGVSVTFLSESGRLMARVDAPVSGNVLLRREQFRQADRPEAALGHARCFVAGKLQSSRGNLLRAARDNAAAEDRDALQTAAQQIASALGRLENAAALEEVRGIEGTAARIYFSAFHQMVRADRENFSPHGRTRRPPLDRTNALLSFTYALLMTDCCSALAAAGLDPNVGYLHADRPGRPSLALDLMEEFRPLLADRLVLTLINRRQVAAEDFHLREGGAVEMSEETRRTLLTAWQERKREAVTHPLLERAVRVGLLPYIQARVLARAIRGELQNYVPCVIK